METQKDYVEKVIKWKNDKNRNTKKNKIKPSDKENRLIKSSAQQNLSYKDNKTIEEEENSEKEVTVEKVKSYLKVKSNVRVKSQPSTFNKTEHGQVLKPHDVNKDKTNFSKDRKCKEVKVENKNVFKGKSDENFSNVEWKIQQKQEKMKHNGKQLGIKGGQLCQSSIMVDKNGKTRISSMDVGNEQTINCGGVDNARSPDNSLPERFTPATSRQQSFSEQTPVKELFVLRDAVENGCKDMESCDKSEMEKDDNDENEKFQKISSEIKRSSKECDNRADKPGCKEHILSAGGATVYSEGHIIHMGGTCQLSLSLASNEIIKSYDSMLADDTLLCRKIIKNQRNQQYHLQKFETKDNFEKESFSSVDLGNSSRKQEQNLESADNKAKYTEETQTELESKNEIGMDVEDQNVVETDNEIVKAEVMDMEDRIEKAGESDRENADLKAEVKGSKTVGVDDWERKQGDLKILTSSLKEVEQCTTRQMVTLENLQNKLQELFEHLTITFRKRSFPRLSFMEVKGQGHRLSPFKGSYVQIKEQNPKKKLKEELSKWDGCKSKGDNPQDPHDADNSSSGNAGGDGKPPCGNSNRRDSGHSHKENSRHHDDEKDIDEQEHPPGKKENGNGDDGYQDNGEDHDKDKESTSPSTNHKFRRKYGMDADMLTEFLGRLANSEEAIPPDILHRVNECLVTCLTTKRNEGLDKLNDCNICVFLLSLLRHFGWCTEGYQQCGTCLKLFRLLQNHLQGCTQNPTCTVIVCQKIQEKIKGDPEKFLNKTEDLWKRLKKYLARCASSFESGTGMNIGVVDEFASMGMPSIGPLTSGGSMGSLGSQSVRLPRVSTTFEPSLGIIFEHFDKIPLSRSYPSGKKSSSAPLATRNKLTGEVTYNVEQETLPSRLRGGRASVTSVLSRKPSIRQPRVSFAEPPPAPDEVFTAPQVTSASIQAEGHDEIYKDLRIQEEPVSLNHEKTYGTVPTFSMPLGYKPEIFHEQLLSLEDQPTGTPGVNEVVYGTRKQLKTVIKHWSKEKEMIQKQGQLSHRHIREEGVILVDHKEKFEIFRTRYQKNFQWIRLTHLGSGMSGKCHLAMDYNTEYKFCIKKIYLAKYEELELDVWSDLNHSNIVQLHGAIRRGIKVYIFAEFIDGGCLTKTIDDQKMMNRRLSHRMALLYLQQLLHVLVYLEKKSVIHEDIKADNILLRQNSTQIVLTDFGVASRFIQHHTQRGTSPIGTPATFSPEKAQSRGHGVKSDVWSAICVLIHMLSGSPPWVKRFPFAKTLNYIIASKDAPVNDLPQNVSQDVRSLVEFGLIKDPEFRPTAAELLQHRAFKVLDELSTTDTAYSVLMSSESQPTSNTLAVDPADETDKASGIEPNVGTTESSTAIIDKIDEFLSTQFEGTNIGNETQKSEIHGTQWSQSEEINSGKIILSAVGNTEAGYYSSKHFGVVLPPEPPVYREEDPMMYLKKYLNDSMKNCTLPPRNAGEVIVCPVHKLELYEPKPRKRSTSSDSDKDIDEKIKKIIEPDKNALPDFTALFDDIEEPENKNLPDEFEDLMTKALTQGIQKSQEDKDTLTIHRSTSSREDSAKLDQELLQLQMQVNREVIDIESHESLIDLLGASGSGQNRELLHEPHPSHVETEELPLTTLKKSAESSENAVCVNIPKIVQSINDENPTDVTPVQLDPLSLSNESGLESHEAEVISTKTSDPGEISSSLSRSNNSGKTSPSDLENPAELPHEDNTEEEQLLASPLPDFSILSPEEENCHSDEMFGSGLTNVAGLISQTAYQIQCTVTESTQLTDIRIDKSSGAIPKYCNTAVTQSLYHQQQRNIDQLSAVIDPLSPLQPSLYPPGSTNRLGNNSVLQEPVSFQPDSIYRNDKENSKPCEPASLQYQSTPKSNHPVGQSSSIKREGSPRLDFRKLQKGPRNRNRSEPSLTPINPDKPKKPTYFTPQQDKQYLRFSNDAANITSGLGTGSSSKSAPFFGTGNGNASSGVFSSSPDDKKRDFNTMLDQHDQEISYLIRDMSHHSEASHDTSLIEELEEMEEKTEAVQFSLATEDEDLEYQSLLQYTNEMYVKETVTDKRSSGILVKVMLEEEKLFEMKLQGEHVNEAWETILEKEINDKIHDKGMQKFTIKDKNGEYLKLDGIPAPGIEVLQVLKVEDDDCNRPWHCDSSMIMK